MSKYTLGYAWDILDVHEMRNGGVRAIMGTILGWEVFSGWPGYQQKYGAQEYRLGAGQPYTTPTHAAFWAREWRVFTPDHKDLFVFEPLHELADAQRILDHLHEDNGVLLVHFATHLLDESIEAIDGKLPWLYWMNITQQSWTPAQICRAAYEAVRNAQREESEAQV